MISITEQTARASLQALAELPLKFSLPAYSELAAALQALAAKAATPAEPAQ